MGLELLPDHWDSAQLSEPNAWVAVVLAPEISRMLFAMAIWGWLDWMEPHGGSSLCSCSTSPHYHSTWSSQRLPRPPQCQAIPANTPKCHLLLALYNIGCDVRPEVVVGNCTVDLGIAICVPTDLWKFPRRVSNRLSWCLKTKRTRSMSMKKDGMMYGPWNPIPTFSMTATSLEMCIFANGLQTTCTFGACLGTFDEPDLHELCRGGFVRELDQCTQAHAPSWSRNSRGLLVYVTFFVVEEWWVIRVLDLALPLFGTIPQAAGRRLITLDWVGFFITLGGMLAQKQR